MHQLDEAKLCERVGNDQAAARERDVVEDRFVARVDHADVQRALLEVQRERAMPLHQIDVERGARRGVGLREPLRRNRGQVVVARERGIELLGSHQTELDQRRAEPPAMEHGRLRRLLELRQRGVLVLQQELREGHRHRGTLASCR